jgi:hypothetical protein
VAKTWPNRRWIVVKNPAEYGQPSGTLQEAVKKFGKVMKEGVMNSGGIETRLMATIKGQNNDMSFLDGVSDEQFVVALKNLGMKFKTSDSGMSVDYYIGRPGNGIMFSNEDGNWFADDWARG